MTEQTPEQETAPGTHPDHENDEQYGTTGEGKSDPARDDED